MTAAEPAGCGGCAGQPAHRRARPPARVTVLLPARDVAPYLPAALTSLRRQTLREHEVLVIDDGSRDRTLAVAQAAAERDPRVRVLARPREGIAAALNAGLAAARGDLIARADADDVCHPRRLELQAAWLATAPAPVAVVGCRFRFFPRRNVTQGMAAYEAWQNGLLEHTPMAAELYVESPLTHATGLFRRAALEAVGGWSTAPIPEDLDLWLRLVDAGYHLAKIPETLYFWRERPDRATRRDPRCSAAAFRALKVQHLVAQVLRGGSRPFELWGVGASLASWAADLTAAGAAPVRARVLDSGAVRARPPAPPPLPRTQLVVLVFGSAGPRQALREVLRARGAREGDDVLFVA